MNALKSTIAAIAVGATALVPMATPAAAHQAGYRHTHTHGPIVRCSPRNNFCGAPHIGVRKSKRKHGHRKYVRRHHNNSDIAGAAILGIIGGALIGSAIANSNRQPRYVAPRPVYRNNQFPPAPQGYRKVVTHSGSLEPWTRGWYQYCDAKYRSFNPEKGTYRGYDGRDHFCVAR